MFSNNSPFEWQLMSWENQLDSSSLVGTADETEESVRKPVKRVYLEESEIGLYDWAANIYYNWLSYTLVLWVISGLRKEHSEETTGCSA